MKIAICDDEKSIRDMIADKVRRLYPKADIEVYSSGEEFLAGESDTDILLLDIYMDRQNDGHNQNAIPKQNGMETAEIFRRRNVDAVIIFVTALEEYVYQAFDVDAFHYLVKPFAEEKFASVMQRAVTRCREIRAVREGTFHIPGTEEKCIIVKRGGTCTRVRIADIIYAEVFNRKVVLHLTNGDLEYYGRMTELAQKAGEDFFRPHRAYLIHFKYVVRYDAATIWLERGTALMAKQNYPEFVKKYLQYNRRNEGET